MDMSRNSLKVQPIARYAAVIPVLLIAGACVAFLLGYRLEGRKPYTVTWRNVAVAEQSFSITTPGLFIVNQQNLDFQGLEVPARTYAASDMTVNYSISAVRRPESDGRSFAEVAESFGVRSTDTASHPSGATMFRHDVIEEGTRTQARLIFHDRMMYQLMVVSPQDKFPVADAERFFSSFRLMGKS